MKKLFFSLVAVILAATKMYAQSSLVATLNHDGEITTFYGNRALKAAHEAAQHGDAITLSSGSFEAVDITKAVTIRGAGMRQDTVAKINPTCVTGNFKIDIDENLEQRLTIEGIYFGNNTVEVWDTLKNATFMKSRFYKFTHCSSSPHWGYMKNLTFIHCIIANGFGITSVDNSVSFVNCAIREPVFSSNSGNSVELTNCVVRWTTYYRMDIYSRYVIYRNCILTTSINNCYEATMPTTNLIYNCLGITECLDGMFKNHDQTNSSMCYNSTNLSDVFKTWRGSFTDTETFELTDDAKTKYLGDDGKELGIYGGNTPFTPNPSNPRITKFNVASKSTADGKLSVDIEVKAAE